MNTTRSALAAAAADLRARLTNQPISGAHGDPLPLALVKQLDAMIARFPDHSHGAIARMFARETGRKIARTTVASRRSPRPEANRLAPFTPDQITILEEIIRAGGADTRRVDVAREFTARTGRSIGNTTVSNYAVRRLGMESRRGLRGTACTRRAYGSAADWPAWTDIAFDLPLSQDDRFTLGPVPLMLGGVL